MRDRPDTLMLFAAGRGTRMAPLTDHVPKPMIKVAGKPLIDHALELARDAGITRIVVNTHYLPDILESHLSGHDIQIIREAELLETGGGLRNALPLLGSKPVLTLNTDAAWASNPIPALLDIWQSGQMSALLCLIQPNHALGHKGSGDFLLDETGALHRGPGAIYAGLQIIDTRYLHDIPDKVFSLNLVWDKIAEHDGLFGHIHNDRWCDVGQPESIALAEGMIGV